MSYGSIGMRLDFLVIMSSLSYSAMGEIKLAAGDCLLLVVEGPEFVNKHRNNSTFALVAQVGKKNHSVDKADCSKYRLNNPNLSHTLKEIEWNCNPAGMPQSLTCLFERFVSLHGADLEFHV